MIHLGILGSTRGTNMLAILTAIAEQRLAAEIKVVVSNRKDALILSRAIENNLSAEFIDPVNLSRPEYDQKITATLQAHAVDLVVLTGYMRILSANFVSDWENQIINVHPSLLPAFAGKMDLDVHRAVLAEGLQETGCTVHYVTQDVDAGPILLQKKCPVLATDTPESLKERVQQLEGEALVDVIRACELVKPKFNCS